MTNQSGQGPSQKPQRLGATYSVVLGAFGALTSILALVQLFTTENALIITLLLAAVLGLAVVAFHYTWHLSDPRLRWLASLTVAALTLAGLGGGFGLGRVTAPAVTSAPAGPGSNADGPGPTTVTPVVSAGGASTVAAPVQKAGALLFARVTPATTDTFSGSWKTESVSVEAVKYQEAIVARSDNRIYCGGVRYVEYVLGRKYKLLTGKVTLADDSEGTAPVPFALVLDGTVRQREEIGTTTLQLNVDLTGVNRIRFELNPDPGCSDRPVKIAFVNLTAEP